VVAINRELKRPVRRDSLFIVGSIHLANGDGARAMEAFLAALQVDGFFDGKRNEGMRPVLVDGSLAAMLAGQADSALTLARAAGEIAAVDSLALTGSAFVGEARLREAKALAALGYVAEARARAAEAVTALAAGAGDTHPRTVEAKAFLKEV
jgi:hypothetical protein